MSKHKKEAAKSNDLTSVKQAFLASAISDISAYIQLADTKVSIIMAAIVAVAVGVFQGFDPIQGVLSKIRPCSWIGISLFLVLPVFALSFVCIFIFGISTIKSHSSKIDYKSKWFLPQSTKEYSFDAFRVDVQSMSEHEIIDNMAAELYKLNDINRQKQKSYKRALISFSLTLITGAIACIILILAN